MAASTITGMRRAPVQNRSAARVERMLAAAATLAAERGYDATTTSLIARRARVSVGSLYQFFPDKRAIFRALADRRLAEFTGRLDQVLRQRFPAGADFDWPAAVGVTIDSYADMIRSVPGFAGLGDCADVRLLDTRRTNNEVLADALADRVAGSLRHVDPERLRLAVLVAVEIADALVTLAFQRDPRGDEAIIEDAKMVICDHLGRHLPLTA